MSENKVHLMLFNDGAAYEKMMGSWSRLVGEVFIDWLAPNQGLRWLDVGCGNGAFSDLISSSCSPVFPHIERTAPNSSLEIPLALSLISIFSAI